MMEDLAMWKQQYLQSKSIDSIKGISLTGLYERYHDMYETHRNSLKEMSMMREVVKKVRLTLSRRQMIMSIY